MITIQMNGEAHQFEQLTDLAALLKQQGYVAGCFAVALNETFIPASQYGQVQLKSGDNIEIVAPMQGG